MATGTFVIPRQLDVVVNEDGSVDLHVHFPGERDLHLEPEDAQDLARVLAAVLPKPTVAPPVAAAPKPKPAKK